MAVVREIAEEAGIDISSLSLELVDEEGSGQARKVLRDTGETVLCDMDFKIFRVTVPSKAAEIPIKLKADLAKHIWADPVKLNQYELITPSNELFKRLGML